MARRASAGRQCQQAGAEEGGADAARDGHKVRKVWQGGLALSHRLPRQPIGSHRPFIARRPYNARYQQEGSHVAR